MASINGDWFHSRTSSNWDELVKVRTLVLESQKPEYIDMGWSGGRHGNAKMHRFARVAQIEPSTMQTKIRAMIRYGFIKDGNQCPLVWTRMGSLWNDLYTVGNFQAAQRVYELTLTISLAIFAFNNSPEKYTINPALGEMPLRFLFNNLDTRRSLALSNLQTYVDGTTKRKASKNLSYWKKDLINAGLFRESSGRLEYTGQYEKFVDAIKNFQPNPLLTDDDWQAIRDNPLIAISPFKDSIGAIFESIAQEQPIEEQIADEILTAPLVDVVSEQEELQIPDIEILSQDLRFAHSMRRVRNATWASRIKKKYNNRCAVPNCDVTGQIFVEAAHIKPDNLPDDNPPHRAHILNGICLCRHCHIAFDKGYFSLADDHRVIVSGHLTEIPDQNLKTVILSSQDIQIKDRTDRRLPLVEFIRYHRANKFRI
jgi:predicted restriction endonuclease